MNPKEIFIVRNHYTGALCRDCFVDRAAAERAASTLNAGSDSYNVRYVVDILNLVETGRMNTQIEMTKQALRKGKKAMKPPFGWKVDPKRRERLMVYEPEAVIVRQMFQLLSQGTSPDKIAKLFTEAGIPDPGERHAQEYMERFFLHMGWKTPSIEPIIDRDLFEAAVKKLDEAEQK